MNEFTTYILDARELIILFASHLVLAIIILVAGLWLIGKVLKLMIGMMEKKEVDESLQPFLRSVVTITLKIILIISVISILGVPTTSFIALLGSAGLAIGLALQGSLANFAGGILILTIKPFKKGDFISAQGESGTVFQISIFNTILKTPNNQIVYIPNGKLAGSTITNFSTEATRRLVNEWGIGYNDDIPKAKAVLSQIIDADERILKDPAPSIVVTALGDSAVNITSRVWCTNGDYWAVNFELHEKVKMTFDSEDITIPFPQRDVHFHPAQVNGVGTKIHSPNSQ